MLVSAALLSYNNATNDDDNNDQIMKLKIPPEKIAVEIVAAVFIIELVFLVWALYLASKCPKQYRLLHILLAIFFPVLYVIYMSFACKE